MLKPQKEGRLAGIGVLGILLTAGQPCAAGPIDDALQDISKNQPESATGAVIATICPQGVVEPRLQQDCNTLVGGALNDQTKGQSSIALTQVTSDQASAPLDASQNSILVQGSNIASRIAALRAGAMGLSTGGLSMNIDGHNLPAGMLSEDLDHRLGGSAGADSSLDFGRLGIFINGTISDGDKDRTANTQGFDFDTLGITVGADYRFTDQLILGAAVGYINNDIDLDANGGTIDTDGYSLSLYGTYYHDQGLFLDGLITYGSNDYDQRRNIRYNIDAVSVEQAAFSDFDGDQWSAAFGGGYNFNRGALSFGPTGRLEYVSADVDGYSETMSNPTADGGGWATRVSDQDKDSFTLQLGGGVAYAISQNWGVLVPRANLEWVHEFIDDDEFVNGSFLQDPTGTSFDLFTDRVDTDYFNLRVGVSAQFAKGTSAYLDYRKLLGYSDLDIDAFSAGVRMDF